MFSAGPYRKTSIAATRATINLPIATHEDASNRVLKREVVRALTKDQLRNVISSASSYSSSTMKILIIRQLLLRYWMPMLALAALIGAARMSPAYSVLTHEEVVDLLGKDQIRPLLVKRFPFAQRRRPECRFTGSWVDG